MQVSIRQAHIQDAPSISELLVVASQEFVVGEFSEEGRAYYLSQLTPERVVEKLSSDFRFYVAEINNRLAGVAAIRANTHLYYLFVAKPFHRKGTARRLWEVVKADAIRLGNPGLFTVNASRVAVSAYERLGFVQKESAKELQGIRYTPMEFTMSA